MALAIALALSNAGLAAFASAAFLFDWSVLRCRGASLHACRDALAQDILNYQTLIAGVLAVGAAVAALRPAYKQLAKMNIQSAVMTRDVVAARLKETEARLVLNSASLKRVTSDFLWELHPGEPEDGPAEVRDEWCFEAEQIVGRVIAELRDDEAHHHDPRWLDEQRGLVLDAAAKVQETLDAITLPERIERDDENQVEEDELAGYRAAEEAGEKRLLDEVLALDRASKGLTDAFKRRIAQLRQTLGRIDDLVINSEVQR